MPSMVLDQVSEDLRSLVNSSIERDSLLGAVVNSVSAFESLI